MDRVIGFLEKGQRLEAVKLFMETMLFKPGDWEQVPLESRERWIDNAHTFLEDWRDPDGWSVPGKLDLEALGAFPHPVLLTCGRTSPAFFLSTMPALEQAMPRARVHEYPDAGHVPQASHPDEYVRVLTDHLRSVECQALTAR